MINDTITLAIEGDVSLLDFAHAMGNLGSLIVAIQNETIANSDLRWVVDGLSTGSAITRLRGIGSGAEVVVAEYEKIGTDASVGRMPTSSAIRHAVIELTRIIGRNGTTSLRFETRGIDSEIMKPLSEDQATFAAIPVVPVAHGSVRGRIQSITNRKSLQFTLYDLNKDHAVSCYLEPGSEQLMRKAWGKIATVSGIVRRNPGTGQPTTVRGIKPSDIHLIPELSGSWRDAIGASRSKKDEITSDAAIQKGARWVSQQRTHRFITSMLVCSLHW